MNDNTDLLLTPLSLWIQLANLFFLLAGLHGDLLIIRLALFLAYFMVLVNSLLGSPMWPFYSSSGIGIDGLVWGSVSLYVHGSSLWNLILDEREVHLTPDEDALWRMLYRTGGLSKRLFQTILSEKLAVVDLPTGQTIDTQDYFYIIYDGQVRLQVVEENVATSSRILVSGEMFDLLMIGLFSGRSIFHMGTIRCTTLTPVKLFRIAKDDMTKISNHPLAKSVWQALLINNLSYVVESSLSSEDRSSVAELYRDKIFRPLEPWEMPKGSLAGSGKAWKYPLEHLARYIQTSFSLPWPLKGHPTGIRQTQLPPPPQQPPQYPQTPPQFHQFQSQQQPPTSSDPNHPNAGTTTDEGTTSTSEIQMSRMEGNVVA